MMGRRRQANFDDPPRFHRKGNVWYHVSGTLPRVWTKLSNDRAEALRLWAQREGCLLYTSPSPRDKRQSRMPSSA